VSQRHDSSSVILQGPVLDAKAASFSEPGVRFATAEMLQLLNLQGMLRMGPDSAMERYCIAQQPSMTTLWCCLYLQSPVPGWDQHQPCERAHNSRTQHKHRRHCTCARVLCTPSGHDHVSESPTAGRKLQGLLWLVAAAAVS
jgi:hypothetical protein